LALTYGVSLTTVFTTSVSGSSISVSDFSARSGSSGASASRGSACAWVGSFVSRQMWSLKSFFWRGTFRDHDDGECVSVAAAAYLETYRDYNAP
jgi:hypothetical protein